MFSNVAAPFRFQRVALSAAIMASVSAWSFVGVACSQMGDEGTAGVMLGFRKEIEGAWRLVEPIRQIADVFGDAYNFVLVGGRPAIASEVFSYSVLAVEIFPRKRLIDDGHGRGSRSVPLRNSAPFNNGISYGVK